jgi:hypothetical protein
VSAPPLARGDIARTEPPRARATGPAYEPSPERRERIAATLAPPAQASEAAEEQAPPAVVAVQPVVRATFTFPRSRP